MPLILAPGDLARWLGEEPAPRDLMRPFPARPMRMWPISTRVNKPENHEKAATLTGRPLRPAVVTPQTCSTQWVVKPRLHVLTGSKERNGLSADRNQGTSSRISTGPAFPKLYKKSSKSPQFDPITTGHCRSDLCNNCVDDLLSILPIEMRVLE
jgi:hypothetical protein